MHIAEATETYLDYVKTWTVENDRGKLSHVTNDAYRFFCTLEEAAYELLQGGINKQGAISQVMGNAVVDFYWNITDGLIEILLTEILLAIHLLFGSGLQSGDSSKLAHFFAMLLLESVTSVFCIKIAWVFCINC